MKVDFSNSQKRVIHMLVLLTSKTIAEKLTSFENTRCPPTEFLSKGRQKFFPDKNYGNPLLYQKFSETKFSEHTKHFLRSFSELGDKFFANKNYDVPLLYQKFPETTIFRITKRPPYVFWHCWRNFFWPENSKNSPLRMLQFLEKKKRFFFQKIKDSPSSILNLTGVSTWNVPFRAC